MFLYIKQNVNSLCRNLFTDLLQFYRRRKSVQVFLHIKKVEMYGIEIPISTYRTQGAITFKVLSLKHRKYLQVDISYVIKKGPARTLFYIYVITC